MFEPIDLGNPIAAGLGDIGNVITNARKTQRDQEEKRAQLLLQKQASQRADSELQLQRNQFARSGKNQENEEMRRGAEDFKAIYEASGKDPTMARELAKAHGYEIIDSPAGPVAVKSQGGTPQMPAAPQAQNPGASAATPEGGQFAPWAGQRINQPDPSPTQPPPTPGPAVPGDGLEPFPGDASAASPAQAPPTAAETKNPIMAAFRLRKNGHELSVDPAAAKAADEEKFAEALKLRNAAPAARIAATQAQILEKQKFLLDHPELKNQPMTFDELEKLAKINAGGRITAARVSQETPLKVDAGTRQDMGTLERTYKDWIGANQLAIDSKTNKRLQTAASNLDSGNAMQQREAAESLVSIFKGGGQVTKASQDLLLKNLSGIVGDAQTWLQHLETGHYGERELGVLKQAADNALKEQNERMATAQQSAVDTFGPGSGFENLGGNVNHKMKGFFRQFGLDNPDIYPEQEAPTAVLGSGKKPKANPIVKAAKGQESDSDFLNRVLK